jgi:hypothetical protein
LNIDFIGIGAGKAGTTWVSEMLDTHPEICMSEPKELNYSNEFAYDNPDTENPNYGNPLKLQSCILKMPDQVRSKTIESSEIKDMSATFYERIISR